MTSNTKPTAALTVLPYLVTTDSGVYLQATHCSDCGYRTFPPSTVCPQCMSLNMSPLALQQQGRLYSYTTMRHGPDTVYAGYVDFPERVRVFGHLGGFTTDTPPACDSTVRVVAAKPVEGARTSAPVDFRFVPLEVE
jgi:uncharacterized OB-fold protein